WHPITQYLFLLFLPRAAFRLVSCLMSLGDFCMQLRLFLAFFTSLLIVAVGIAQAQTPGTGTVTISGSEQGPIYPCGNTSCPTYYSGQITITVDVLNSVNIYCRTDDQRTNLQV